MDITPDPLMLTVAEVCRVPVKHMRGPKRWHSYCRARHIYAYVAHTVMHDSFGDIAYILNRSNHSVPLKGYRRLVANREAYEPYLSRVLAAVSARVAA